MHVDGDFSGFKGMCKFVITYGVILISNTKFRLVSRISESESQGLVSEDVEQCTLILYSVK